MKKLIVILVVVISLVCLKAAHVAWHMRPIGSFQTEKQDILDRSSYLKGKLTTSPQSVLDAMPSFIGNQFRGEWALYSCSMYARALTNIARLYPEQKKESIATIDRLIEIVLSSQLREYDYVRWARDPLDDFEGTNSHISYYSHLAWMIGGYKSIGGDSKYDEVYQHLCAAMNRRIVNSPSMNLPTYPGEPIYVPDMLLAIAALEEYSQFYDGKYHDTVQRWVDTMKRDYTDSKTGLLNSYICDGGIAAPIRGSFAALNCYYLTMVDEEFARDQYEKLKANFFQTKRLTGAKEFVDGNSLFGLDIDSGPIIMNLSPSGTAFALGVITFFDDKDTRTAFLRTAEIAGNTVSIGGQSHYLLANLALVGEAITLAARTSANFQNN
ncbi:MAG: hypothetical protein KBT10_08340 [Bacteroidales bacterium]|nr:hypothetical protein [Candidatus Sodaliphilus aphodohippi]